VSAVQVAVEQLSGCPQHAQYEQNTYERRQVCDTLEHRHEHQTAYTNPEHSLTLTLGEVGVYVIYIDAVQPLKGKRYRAKIACVVAMK
jgi:hypothetical protein